MRMINESYRSISFFVEVNIDRFLVPITIVGALTATGSGADLLGTILGTAALIFATINVVGGYLVTNRMLAQALGRALNRPAFMPAPALFMKAALGEFSSVLLGSQKAAPERLRQSGFEFRYATLSQALEAILG